MKLKGRRILITGGVIGYRRSYCIVIFFERRMFCILIATRELLKQSQLKLSAMP